MSDTLTQPSEQTLSGERAALQEVLNKTRNFLRYTVQGLTDEQATLTPTVSELSLAGLIKHVTAVEKGWADFILEGTRVMKNFADLTEEDYQRRIDDFRLLPGETLDSVLAAYDEVARRTSEVIATVPSLDTVWPLPEAPWFTDREWSTRQAIIHIIAETAQHAGHADIIRETIDGQKTMG